MTEQQSNRLKSIARDWCKGPYTQSTQDYGFVRFGFQEAGQAQTFLSRVGSDVLLPGTEAFILGRDAFLRFR